MDPTKTGALIRALRKERNMTQKDLAERLHITDRAVSKWERGLCAPDISLLEPLADILGISILELIQGERSSQPEAPGQAEAHTRQVLDYSKSQLAHKLRSARKRYLGLLAACLLGVGLLCGMLLWKSGVLFVMDRSVSPDGQTSVTVYRKAFDHGGFSDFSLKDAASLRITGSNGAKTYITYGDCTYGGLWWAPDSSKYVIALQYDDGTYLALSWLDRHSESNLNAYLSMGVEATELRKDRHVDETGFPEIKYQFLQWGLDSASMLIYYAFEDSGGGLHDGYFWYNCESGAVDAILELN